MREFQERRRVKRLLHSRYAIAALLIVLLVLVRAVWSAYQKYEKSKDISVRIAAEYKALEEREKTLSSSLADLGTDEGKEREIRDKFGAVKDGEKLIVLVDDQAPKNQAAVVTEKGLWQRIKDWFSGN